MNECSSTQSCIRHHSVLVVIIFATQQVTNIINSKSQPRETISKVLLPIVAQFKSGTRLRSVSGTMFRAGKSFSMELQRHEILTMTGFNLNLSFFVIMMETQNLKLVMGQKQVRSSTNDYRHTYSQGTFPSIVELKPVEVTHSACTILPSIGRRNRTAKDKTCYQH